MKKALKIMIMVLIIIFFSGCNKNNNNVLNVLNWSSYIPDEVISDFEKETGIKVNYSTYSSNEELLAKISSSKEGTYDLAFPSDYMVELMKNKGYLQEIDHNKLNNFSNIKSDFLNLKYDSDNKFSIPFLASSVVIIKNNDNINDKIVSYNDLLNPSYKNDIVIIDDQRIVSAIALLALGYDVNEKDPVRIKEAEKWLLKLKNNIKAFDSDSPKMFLISKEVDMGVLWNAEAAIAMNEISSLEVIYPKEGTLLSIDNFVLLKECNNKENAYLFIDYILRPEVMVKILEWYPYKSVNSKVDEIISKEYLNNNASNFPDYLVYNGFFIDNIGEHIKLYDELWANIK